MLSLSVSFVFFVFCSLSIKSGDSNFNADSNNFYERNKKESKPNEYAAEVVKETLGLLSQGQEKIRLLPGHRDIVLIIGNPGAGKTTIAKFLTTDGSDMETYKKGGRILIRDRAGKIGMHSTVKSQTIFPELMIHPETGLACYDMPGFSDTRNVAIPIANAFFMRKVAKHARKVKILFIVDHASVRPGESRTDFLSLVKESLKLIKDVPKFSPGIALIVSKVRMRRGVTVDELISDIGEFLTDVHNDLPDLLWDEDLEERAQSLIKVFLTQTKGLQARRYERIGLFLQPTKIGPLTEDLGYQPTKALLEEIVYKKTQFVRSAASDFGLSLEADAEFLVRNLAREVFENLQEKTTALTKSLDNYHLQLSASSSNLNANPNLDNEAKIEASLVKLTKQLDLLENLVKKLSETIDWSEFFKTIVQEVPKLQDDQNSVNKRSNSNDITDLVQQIEQLNSQREFFEEIVTAPSIWSFNDRLVPWNESLRVLRKVIQVKDKEMEQREVEGQTWHERMQNHGSRAWSWVKSVPDKLGLSKATEWLRSFKFDIVGVTCLAFVIWLAFLGYRFCCNCCCG